jgi:hypothetical protein
MSCSPRNRSRARLVTNTFSWRHAAKQIGDQRRRSDDLLKVVEQEQQIGVAQCST